MPARCSRLTKPKPHPKSRHTLSRWLVRALLAACVLWWVLTRLLLHLGTGPGASMLRGVQGSVELKHTRHALFLSSVRPEPSVNVAQTAPITQVHPSSTMSCPCVSGGGISEDLSSTRPRVSETAALTSSKLTIAAFTKAWSTHSHGGLGKHADNLYRGLAARGHTVHVFTSKIHPSRLPEVDLDGRLVVHYSPVGDAGSLTPPFQSWCRGAMDAANAVLLESGFAGFDIIHQESSVVPLTNFSDLVAAGVPIVPTWHGDMLDVYRELKLRSIFELPTTSASSPAAQLQEEKAQALFRNSAVYLHNQVATFQRNYVLHIVLTERARLDLIRLYNVDAERVVVIHHSTDTAKFPFARQVLPVPRKAAQRHLTANFAQASHSAKSGSSKPISGVSAPLHQPEEMAARQSGVDFRQRWSVPLAPSEYRDQQANRGDLLDHANLTQGYRHKHSALSKSAPVVVIGYACWLQASKGSVTFLAALKEFLPRHPHVWVLVAGGGVEEILLEYHTLAQREDVGGRLIMLGELQPSDMGRFYAAIDVFVDTSLHHTGSNGVLVEAALSGAVLLSAAVGSVTMTNIVPQVVTSAYKQTFTSTSVSVDLAGLAYISSASKAPSRAGAAGASAHSSVLGYTFQPGNEHHLTAVLARVIRDAAHSRLDSAALASREHALAGFDLKSMLDKYEQTLLFARTRILSVSGALSIMPPVKSLRDK